MPLERHCQSGKEIVVELSSDSTSGETNLTDFILKKLTGTETARPAMAVVAGGSGPNTREPIWRDDDGNEVAESISISFDSDEYEQMAKEVIEEVYESRPHMQNYLDYIAQHPRQ